MAGATLYLLALSICIHHTTQLSVLDNGCPLPPDLQHGTVQLSKDQYNVEYTCNMGFTMVGHSEAKCIHRLWEDQPPLCIASGCEQLHAIANGYVEIQYGGALAHFRCDSGYSLKGSSDIVCDGRMWNGTQPSCVNKADKDYGWGYQSKSNMAYGNKAWHHGKKSHDEWLQEADYSCIKQDHVVSPPRVLHASPSTKWVILDGTPRLYTLYRCIWGYGLIGENKYLYCHHEKWKGQKPKCIARVRESRNIYDLQRDAPLPGTSSHEDWLKYADYSCFSKSGEVTAPLVGHSSLTPLHSVKDGMPHLYVQYKCLPGFTMTSESGFLYCKNKQWEGDIPRCIAGGHQVHGVGCDDHNGGCEQMCMSQPGGGHQCACMRGYILHQDGTTCTDIDECARSNGMCDHRCVNTRGSYKCFCDQGFYLNKDGHKCIVRNNENGRDKPPLVLFHVD